MIKKVLVVGGSGYIGGSVTDYLIEKKIPFSVYDNLTYENTYLKPVDFIFGDIRDRLKLKKVLKKHSHVIWLAAIVGDGASAIKPAFSKEINTDSVIWLSKNFDGRIIFTSTCSVYGFSDKAVTEESEKQPLSIYAQTKLEAEKALHGKNALIFRLGTAFGLGDSYSRIRMDLAVNYMTMNAVKNGQLTIFGGNQWRPFMHVRQIGETIVNNLDKSHKGIFNIANKNLRIVDLAKIIKSETGCKINLTPQKFEDNRNYRADVTKALKAKIFSKKTKYGIRYGVGEIKALVLSNRIKDLESEFYSNERYLLVTIGKNKDLKI